MADLLTKEEREELRHLEKYLTLRSDAGTLDASLEAALTVVKALNRVAPPPEADTFADLIDSWSREGPVGKRHAVALQKTVETHHDKVINEILYRVASLRGALLSVTRQSDIDLACDAATVALSIDDSYLEKDSV
jgi:hypothetical protein